MQGDNTSPHDAWALAGTDEDECEIIDAECPKCGAEAEEYGETIHASMADARAGFDDEWKSLGIHCAECGHIEGDQTPWC